VADPPAVARCPTVADVLALHATVVETSDATEPGVRDTGSVAYVRDHLVEPPFTERPDLHRTAFRALRLLVANHPFVDGNKRTALLTAGLCYALHGYDLGYGPDLESLVRLLAVDERLVRADPAVAHLAGRATAPADGPPADGDPGHVPHSVVAELRDADRFGPAERERVRETTGATLPDLLAVDGLREPVVRAVARADIAAHRELFDRLADS
jgi:death-on-curing protein